MFIANLGQFVALLVQMSHPAWDYLSIIIQPLYETVQMAVLGTTIGAAFAVPFSILAASNLVSNKVLRNLIRFFLDLVRTLPDLLLAAIFVAIFGIGSTAGVVTLAIFSFGWSPSSFMKLSKPSTWAPWRP